MIKTRYIFTALAAVILLSVNSQVMWQISKDNVVKWNYFDGDEFNGPSVDLEKWHPSYSYSEVNYTFDYFMSAKRLEYQDGICKFTCYRDTGLYRIPDWQLDSNFKKQFRNNIVDGNKFKYYYSCGNVWSKGLYGKGYFEMRFKTTDSYGMWPAFWLYGTNQKDEIDFFELKGERENSIHVATHCPEGCDKKYKHSGLFPKPFSGWIKTSTPLTTDYNVLAGEWQDGYVKWYLNGEGIAYFDGDFASQQMSLIIGTGPAKDGYGFAPGVNNKSYFPNSLDVDYVRVWYKEGAPKGNVLGKKQKEFSYYKAENNKEAGVRRKIRYMFKKKEFNDELLTVSVLPEAGKKILVTSLGKDINYELILSDEKGKEISRQAITSTFSELDLSAQAVSSVKITIKASGQEIQETISLR